MVTSADTDLPAGTVISQSPRGGQTAEENTIVTIVVSSYQPPSSPPTVVPDREPDRHRVPDPAPQPGSRIASDRGGQSVSTGLA